MPNKKIYWDCRTINQGQIVAVYDPQVPGQAEGSHRLEGLMQLSVDSSDCTWLVCARAKRKDAWVAIAQGTLANWADLQSGTPTVEAASDLRTEWLKTP